MSNKNEVYIAQDLTAGPECVIDLMYNKEDKTVTEVKTMLHEDGEKEERTTVPLSEFDHTLYGQFSDEILESMEKLKLL